ncbi:MAG: hypothetical protein ACFFD7_14090 [Candidatus Thorarchaeota archaeon]
MKDNKHLNLDKKLISVLIFLLFLIIPTTTQSMNFVSPTTNFSDQVNVNAAIVNYTMTMGAPYSWINISSGTELVLGDNDYIDTALPFNFTFYDGNHNVVTIISEGYLTFSFKSVLTSCIFPTSHPHRQNIIAPYLTNLDGNSGRIYIKNFSTYWVASWEDIDLDNGSYAGTFQSVLYKNGDIIFNYKELRNVGSYACGLNYGDGNNYSSYNQLTSSINEYSIKFIFTTDNINNGGNGGLDQGAINTIVAVVVPIGIVSLVVGITFFFYRKNPEQFKAKLSNTKQRLKKSSAKLTSKIKEGSTKVKGKVSKSEKKVKTKKPTEEKE